MRHHNLRRRVECLVLVMFAVSTTVNPAQAQRASRTSDTSSAAVLVRGQIRAPDGRPIFGALVRITVNAGTLVGLTTSDAEGRFAMAAPNRRMISLEVSAPLRQVAEGRRFVTAGMGDLILTLGSVRPTIDSVRGPRIELLSGRVLDTINTISMTRTLDGKWVAQITSDREVVRYRVRYGRGSDTNLPSAGRIMSIADDGDLPDFVSVAPVKSGVASIVVDPALLPTDTVESQLRVSNRASTSARLEALNELSRAGFALSAKARAGDTAAARRGTDSLARAALRSHDAERDPIVRQAWANTLLLSYWPQLSVAEGRRVRRTLDPRSPVAADFGYPMSITGGLLAEEFPTLRGLAVASDTVFPRRAREAMQAALATPGISAWTRSRLYWNLAFTLGRDAKTQALAAAYADSLAMMPETTEQEVRMMQRLIAPNRPTQVGKPIVSWVVADLDDLSKQHRASDFAGKWTLIDLWGPWCAPCVAEMPALHEAHRVFSSRGLHIVSIDFDHGPESARTFRKEKYPMPWTNGYAGDGMFDSPAARAFGTVGFPTIVLVNPEGKIVSMDVELRGERLPKTLDRLLPTAGTVIP
jgi:thiol-disulfide isomerase/thioredoxin